MKGLITGVLVFLLLLAACTSQHKQEQKEAKQTDSSTEVQKEEALAPPPLPVHEAEMQATDSVSMMEKKFLSAKTMQRGYALQAPAAEMGVGIMPPSAQWNRESYNAVQENRFINTVNDPLSTFSIDVDTAGYANVRRMVTGGHLPPVGAVRIEEMINYFTYDYPAPESGNDFRLHAEIGPSPYHADYQLVRIGLNAKDLDPAQLPPSNLVFLVDVSGSMQAVNKLPLLKQAVKLLVEQMGARDRIGIVAYAGSDRVVLQPTAADDRAAIFAALDQLRSGGSTHASSGIRTAYDLARRSFMPGGNNRVILASDGDFNVGVTSRGELQKLIEEERESGIYLTVLGFGMGNYHDDTMEVLADKGNGNYAYIDSLLEAKKVMVKEMSGTLFALADDVKIQVEFNPARVGAYRLLGYENRALADEDFIDDTKDAGEIGVGHRVTTLYELIPAGHASIPVVDALKYQKPQAGVNDAADELLTVKLRYKPLGQKSSKEMILPVSAAMPKSNSVDFQFAAAVAGYGMLLTESEHLGSFSWDQCMAMAKAGRGQDVEGYRAELYRLVETSELLSRQQPANPPQPMPIRPLAK